MPSLEISPSFPICIDRTRDSLLTDFGLKTLQNQYFLEGETTQELFARVATAFGDDAAHSQRLYDYMSRLWFMPATPILANGGNNRGLPISCFLNETSDSLEGILELWTENAWLSSKGGGLGCYWGNVRSISEKLYNKGSAVGVIPFIKVMESLSLAIDQGSLRRGAAAVYLPVWHPEIEEFIDLRKPTGGDYNRKALYLHHGIIISDAFMEAVENDASWDLISPHTQRVIKTVSARNLWIRILTTRVETGEPYLIFIDAIHRALPEHQKRLNLTVKHSNLCTEITLPTGLDFQGKERTAVCCLSSLNIEKFLEWENHPMIFEDLFRFLDNVLSDFIQKAPDTMYRAVYSAEQERSVGLGAMGLYAFFQSQGIPLESAAAKSWNLRIFSHIHAEAQRMSKKLAEERGACPDAAKVGILERFSNKIAIAPTASISIICGGTSPGIEPFVSNAYTHKTLSGSFFVYNPHLATLLRKKGLDTPEVWSRIVQEQGSVQGLEELNDLEKATFKTAFEMDQRWLIELAADRQPFICQSQSLNLFLSSDIHKRTLHVLHHLAWKKNLKSLYYLRSRSIQRPETQMTAKVSEEEEQAPLPLNYDECLACQ
jgi:ribonucleoside-diphosphate reductase alpha chain